MVHFVFCDARGLGNMGINFRRTWEQMTNFEGNKDNIEEPGRQENDCFFKNKSWGGGGCNRGTS